VPQKADGIVVLTGAATRLQEAARLFRIGLAKRLLISGVNRKTTPQEIRKLLKIRKAQFDCCVDVGYQARDTIGNAAETRLWVQKHGFKKIILVTSSYHMTRSLTELSIVLPTVEVKAHPVVPRQLRTGAWWLDYGMSRTLIAEYLKLMPSIVRFAASQVGWSMREGTGVRHDRSQTGS
jgi:uncharacterized SAM-binding protein YcdF (DUF218 family)